MNNIDEIIQRYYKEAVNGLGEIILQDRDLWYNYIIKLPIEHQVVYTIILFDQQVNNGGLHQYFFNPYGQFAYLTLDNLKRIKAFNTACILEKALAEVNSENYSIDEFREKIFNRKVESITNFDDLIGDHLNDLDNEYYSLNEDLGQLLVSYLSHDTNSSSERTI